MISLARVTDPSTSHEAAGTLLASGKPRHQKAVVFRALSFCPASLISAEIADRFSMARYLVARRLPDLEKGGLIEKTGTLKREGIAKNGIVWKVKTGGAR